MRLKLFEDFKKLYYQKITLTEFDNKRQTNSESFTEKELETILSFFPENSEDTLTLMKDRIDISIQKVYNISFTKKIDEWYLVSHFSIDYFMREHNTNYYKCDQFVGLLKWLEDFKNKLKY